MQIDDCSDPIVFSAYQSEASDLISNSSSKLDVALSGLKKQLKELALSSNAYNQLNFAFDIQDPAVAFKHLDDWSNGIFNDLPHLRILDDAMMANAAGAYSATERTIYLSTSILQQDDLLGLVLAEEYGHYLDNLLNPGQDTVGDEGELFSYLLFGWDVSESDLVRVRAENDFAFLAIDGKPVLVEQSQIAVESFNGRLYQSHRFNDNKIYTRSSLDGTNWTAWHEAGGATNDAPSLAALNGRLYQSVRGTDNNIYTRSSTNGEDWTAWHQTNGKTHNAPALAALSGRLYQSVRGTDNNIYTRSSTNGQSWTAWHQAGGATNDAPALAVLNGRLYQSVRGTDNRIYTRSSTNGQHWTAWHQAGGITYNAPSLESLGGRLYQTHRGTDRGIYTRSSTDGINWTAWHQAGGVTNEAPSLAVLNGRLYQTHEGTDKGVYTRSSLDGKNWTNWHQLGSFYKTAIGSTKGGTQQHIEINQVQGPGFIEDKETWLIFHGWNGHASNFHDLAKAIEEYDGIRGAGADQVLVVDWEAARTGLTSLNAAATWIDTVAEAVKNAIVTWGISGSKINLVGHSLGAYVAYEVSERLGGINRLVALNPATTTAGGYDMNQVNFSRYSNWSWSFWHNNTTDSGKASVTADEAFVLDLPFANVNEGHGAAKKLWTNMLRDRHGNKAYINSYFGLEDIGKSAYKPWATSSLWDARIRTKNDRAVWAEADWFATDWSTPGWINIG
jgi:pimeloyl-ACP methyl ester carboxylesterase